MNGALRFLAVFVLFAPAALCHTTQDAADSQHRLFESGLSSGTNLRLHLHAGDFRVVGGDSERVFVRVEGKNLEQAKNIKFQLKHSGRTVDLKISHVPKNELRVTIEIPKSTNLYVRMGGGDLSVGELAGDKDLELTGGNLTIEVGNPQGYGPVDLSVRFGDISGEQFGHPKGWLGNSVRKNGSGKYRLHAHVFAGDLLLKS